MQTGRLVSVLVTVFAFHSLAQAELKCDSSKTVCFWDNMPLYNQNDSAIGSDLLPKGPSGSMLCSPTSGAMVLQTFQKSYSSRLVASAWTAKTFVANTDSMSEKDRMVSQIRVMAKKMNTNAKTGTVVTNITQAAASRKADFASGTATGANAAFPSSFPISSYQSYLRDNKSALVMNIGYYNRKMTVSSGKTYYSYSRTGGHSLALNGFSGDRLLIYDPWYGVKIERTITTLKKGCDGSVCHNIGSLAYRSVVNANGDKFQFIDNHSRIWMK